MPMFTPSRIAVLVFSISILSFLYTWGLPSQLSQPSQPIIDHYDHKNVHSEPIIPAPWIPTPTPHATHPDTTEHGERPGEEEENRWADAPENVGQAGASETGLAGYEDDSDRLAEKEKIKEAAKTQGRHQASATPVPSTLLTHAIPAPSDLNATIATNATAAAATNTAASEPTAAVPATIPNHKFCKDVAGAPRVMVILRTSKAEMAEKLPTHIKGLLSCVPSFAIFSDHAGSIDGIPVHNALADIGSEAKRTHDEFHEYQLMHADGEHKPDAAKTKDLDKWKFLPMVYKAYHLKPDARFYFFIEADTSLSWTNILQWVDRLDYRIPYYSGAPTFINSVQLAQRGSGIMLSQGALRRYAKSYEELYASRWEPELGKSCCGDLALAQALGDAHVEFYSSWPLMQGEQPASLDYTQKHWCAPAISWHHTNGAILEDIWHAQTNWTAKHGWDTPFLYRDAFESFVYPHIREERKKWDNLSQDTKITAPPGRQKQLKEEAEKKKQQDQGLKVDQTPPPPPPTAHKFHDASEGPPNNKRSIFAKDDKKPDEEINWDKLAETFKEAADSPATCAKTCEAVADCLQWRYKALGDGECHLGKVLRLGRVVGKTDEPWTSGWMVERVEEVKKKWECKKVEWRFYQ